MEDIEYIFEEYIVDYITNLTEEEQYDILDMSIEEVKTIINKLLKDNNIDCDSVTELAEEMVDYIKENLDDIMYWRLSDLRERIESEIDNIGYIPDKDLGILLVRMGANILENV